MIVLGTSRIILNDDFYKDSDEEEDAVPVKDDVKG